MTRLPLFPLGTVLFPGLPLPLQVFEPRYRRLVEDLLTLPDGARRFGVVGIRAGLEVGTDHSNDLYDVGCVAEMRRVVAHPDGRFDILAVGVERFRLDSVGHEDDGLAFGEVEVLGEPEGPEAGTLSEEVHGQFSAYVLALLAARGLEPDELPELPDGARATSFAVAGAVLLGNAEKQRLLEAASVGDRLRLELELLRRETAMARDMSTRPAVEMSRQPYSQN
ncbi:LON peptidase substrate-binding domain-containing protein [Nakamurella alba]|uniref:LON peptidase substrate-binding domain-containing protein n=1 Tax=Nakamurella alba TaxID=2665158 RepID=UPI002AC31CBF|nr:LON peptidase substrate-binding domain-containing protein [Nakamurella alba]